VVKPTEPQRRTLEVLSEQGPQRIGPGPVLAALVENGWVTTAPGRRYRITGDGIDVLGEPFLFGGHPTPTPELDGKTAGERKRARDDAVMALGYHPLSQAQHGPASAGLRLLADGSGHTCGDCAHRFLRRLGGTYPKCDLGPDSGGAATDVLARWPACVRWEATS